MLKFKTGDKVLVIAGQHRGSRGVIEKMFPKKNRAIVGGVNVYKKHVKKTLARDGQGGVYEIVAPINLSNLAVLDPKEDKATRVKFKIQDGKKIRVATKSGKEIGERARVSVKKTEKKAKKVVAKGKAEKKDKGRMRVSMPKIKVGLNRQSRAATQKRGGGE